MRIFIIGLLFCNSGTGLAGDSGEIVIQQSDGSTKKTIKQPDGTHKTIVIPAPSQEEFDLKLKLRNGIQDITLANHPLDLVGWDGFYYPWIFNIKDFMPITGKVHQPPPVHQTFAGPGFVICSFCPRLFDYHELAIHATYAHSNVDSDEVLYYVEGDFMSRKGVSDGSVTIHPSGLPHGPQPGKYEGSIGAKETFEYAVMLDTLTSVNGCAVGLLHRVDVEPSVTQSVSISLLFVALTLK